MWSPSWHTHHHVLNHSKWTKWRRHEEMSLDLFFQKNWSKLSFILFQGFISYSFTSITQITFIALLVCMSNNTKIVQLVKEMKKILENVHDMYMFDDVWFQPSTTTIKREKNNEGNKLYHKYSKKAQKCISCRKRNNEQQHNPTKSMRSSHLSINAFRLRIVSHCLIALKASILWTLHLGHSAFHLHFLSFLVPIPFSSITCSPNYWPKTLFHTTL